MSDKINEMGDEEIERAVSEEVMGTVPYLKPQPNQFTMTDSLIKNTPALAKFMEDMVESSEWSLKFTPTQTDRSR